MADAVCAGLEKRGMRCWIAPRDILPGADWGASIIDGITSSEVMVLIFSENANISPQIKREVERAVAKGRRVVPFRIADVPMSKHLEYFISTSHWLDALTQPLEGHIERLAETIRLLSETRDSREIPPPLPKPTGARLEAARPPTLPTSVMAPMARPSRTPLLLGAAAAAAVALYFFALRKTPPQIVTVNFPPTIAAGSTSTGTVQFKAGADAIAEADFQVVEAQAFEPFTVRPRVVPGEKQGSFAFTLRSPAAQHVTLRATLVDAAGRRSSPVSFSFEVRKGAPAAKGGIEIQAPHGFKFKIPR